MDPFTAICNVITQALKVVEKAIDGQPPEVRNRLWTMYVEDVQAWRDFWKGLISKE